MCRLIGITSQEPLSPMVALHALENMKEGYDGSGLGLFLADLGGDLEHFKGKPVLSGIFSDEGVKKLDRFMAEYGFRTGYELSIRPPKQPPSGTPNRDN